MSKNQNLPLAVIFLTLVLDSIGIGIIIPVLPDLFKEVLNNDNLADVVIWGGILASSFALMQFLFGPILGALSDRYGRKPVLQISLFIMVIDYLIMALAQSLWLLLVGRIIGGITAATHATANAYVADISKPEEKAARFGLLGAGFGIGFVLGPVIGGYLGEYGSRAPFYAAAIMAALNAVLCLIFVKESLKPENRRPFAWKRANPIGAILDLGKFDGLKPLLVVFLLFGIGTAVYPAIWPYFTAERFGWSPGMIGLALTIYGICFALAQGVLVRPLIARMGEYKTVMLGFGFEVFAMILVASITNGTLLLIMIPLASLGVVAHPALQSILSKSVGDDMQGTLQGVLASLHAIAMVITPLVMTWVFSVFSQKDGEIYFPGMPFLASAILVVVCLGLFMRINSSKSLASSRT